MGISAATIRRLKSFRAVTKMGKNEVEQAQQKTARTPKDAAAMWSWYRIGKSST
jgi:hypothetical protein